MTEPTERSVLSMLWVSRATVNPKTLTLGDIVPALSCGVLGHHKRQTRDGEDEDTGKNRVVLRSDNYFFLQVVLALPFLVACALAEAGAGTVSRRKRKNATSEGIHAH
jgi:hypothetical protein